MNIPAVIARVQKAIGFPVEEQDGKAGPATWEAIASKLGASVAEDGSIPGLPVGDLADPRSERAIATLHPKVQPYARALVKSASDQGITIKVTSGLRTYAEQDVLYEQGRSKPGKIVTNARGGYSNHNFGVAFDITIFKGASPVWESPAYKAVGALGRGLGLAWGGDWTTINDEPHFELKPQWAAGINEKAMLAGLRDRHDNGKDQFAT